MDVAAYAKGFLGLINANNRGQGIAQAADYLQAVVDISGMLGANRRGTKDFANPALPGGVATSGTCFTVPAGEAWLVRAGGITMSAAGVGVIGTGHLYVRTPESTSISHPVTSSAIATASTAAATFAARPYEFPELLLVSGSSIGFEAIGSAAGCGITATILYDVLTA